MSTCMCSDTHINIHLHMLLHRGTHTHTCFSHSVLQGKRLFMPINRSRVSISQNLLQFFFLSLYGSMHLSRNACPHPGIFHLYE